MMIAPFLLAAVVVPTQATIVDIHTRIFPAGKLGTRVQTTLDVESGGRTFSIKAPSYHTRMAGAKAPSYRVGDMIRIGKSWF